MRKQVIDYYNCEKSFRGNYRACVATVIRDSSFTCNNRYLFEAYPSKSYMMRYAFPVTDYAVHASDLVALYSNSRSEAVHFLKKLGLGDEAVEKYAHALVDTGILTTYHSIHSFHRHISNC